MNSQMQRLFHTVRDGLFIVSREGQVRFANEAALRLIPCNIGAPLPNAPLQKLLEELQSDRIALPHACRIELGAECLVAEADTIRAHLMASPVGNDLVVILHNLTEQQFYNIAINNLGGMLDRQAGLPLQQFIERLAETITALQRDGQGDALAALRTQVAEEGHRLMDTLSRLAELARVAGGEPIVGDDRIEILPWLSASLDAMRPLAQKRAIRLLLEKPSEELPPIYGSVAWLDRAFREYLDNAIKFGDPKSDVLVSARHNAGFVLITVTNYGAEIPPHLRERLFQALYRGTNAERGPFAGFGLGLPLCKRVVEMHGGHVRVASGDGATDFSMELPTGAPQRETAQLDLAQAQRYAQDLAQLMRRRRPAAG